jgi:hypothetical protein
MKKREEEGEGRDGVVALAGRMRHDRNASTRQGTV